MNIFILDDDPKLAAQAHVDSHIVKMPIEIAQLLSTAHRLNNSSNDILYKITHKNHPCAIWTRSSQDSYNYTTQIGLFLCEEYTHRYNKIHASSKVIEWCKNNPLSLPDINLNPAQAMPEIHKDINPIKAYRQYYATKTHKTNGKIMMIYTNREPPKWLDKPFTFNNNKWELVDDKK